MRTALVVFTRDLRTTDHPALCAAARADRVVPLFVFDDRVVDGGFLTPNRGAFLLDALADLDRALTALGAPLVIRRGDWVTTVLGIARDVDATEIHLSDDVSAFAQRRLTALRDATAAADVAMSTHPGVTVVEPGAVVPVGATHYQVFTPYHRRWLEVPRRAVLASPDALTPTAVEPGARPTLAELVDGVPASELPRGGATVAHERLDDWVHNSLATYHERHDDLAGDRTSHLSAHLHLGCLSPLEVLRAVRNRPGNDAFARQLCWRDFFAQLLAARPEVAWRDVRPTPMRWRDDPEGVAAWKDGRTGYPVVDAAMRQLRREGFVHNRARMVAASFLTKDLSVDWRVGARHFLDHLVDGDVANNNLNWQWVAGTGTDSNPNRIFNPTVQGTRFDPEGEYVRRYVPELVALRGSATHDPDLAVREAYGYPLPIVDHHDAIEEHRARRAG